MSLNVIALVSGGKDSFFSILHCIANGHKVVALANLHPAPTASDNEDINSYMYQTVGHSVIPLYEQALGIPLYRQEITGKAVNSARDYAAPRAQQEQDETEDLVPLLQKAMLAHPEANAVCSGAILSTYQRTRVESVALRLGLAPLSFLWQYPLLPPYSQSQLLFDMAAVGQEAIVIKTASGGLDERILGWNVAAQSTITKLQKAMARFGEESNGAVVGEGGEFETLALDGPRPLWKKKIRIEPGAAGVSEAGQSVLKVRASELEDKSDDDEDRMSALRIPDLFDDEFKKVLQELDKDVDDARSFVSDDATLVPEPPAAPLSSFGHLPRNASTDSPTLFTYSNLSDTSRSSIPNTPSPSRQLTKILLRLDHVLKQWNLSRAEVNHCTLLLRCMSDFAVLNPIYGQYFSGVNPPARVTVAVGDCMPEGIDVLLSIVIDKDARDRKGRLVRSAGREGLHVQGRSYWAPANIGPYSQAISARLPLDATAGPAEGWDVVYVAGQIPLIPASMDVYTERGFKGQATLSLQHLWRIGRAKGVRWWTSGVAFIPACADAEEKVRIAQATWRSIHAPSKPKTAGLEDDDYDDTDYDTDEDDTPIDPWDRRNTHTTPFNDTTPRPQIPHPTSSPAKPPPCFVAQVTSLPRAVDIEWSALGLAPSSPSPSSSSTTTTHTLTLTRPPQSPHLTLTTPFPPQTNTHFFTLELLTPHDMHPARAFSSATLYAAPAFAAQLHSGAAGLARLVARGVQWIPCRRVWGEGGREVGGVLVGRVDGGDEEGSVVGVGVGGGMQGVEGLVKGIRFTGRGVREALEGVGRGGV